MIIMCDKCGNEKKVPRFQRFCSKKCYHDSTKGKPTTFSNGGNLKWNAGFKEREKNPMWKGGRWVNKEGYIWIYTPKHPYCTTEGYVKEHRLVMEKHIGRYLKRKEYIHHINGVKNDNCIENLQIMSPSEHAIHHWADRRFQYA